MATTEHNSRIKADIGRRGERKGEKEEEETEKEEEKN